MRFAAILCCALPLCAQQSRTITYWIEPCTRAQTGCQSDDPQLAEWALEAWQKASGGRLQLTRSNRLEEARLRIYWVSGEQGRYGEAVPIRVNGQPGAEVHVRPDVRQLGPEIAAASRDDPLYRHSIVYLTCLHESGHALGLPHTAAFDDIMYSFAYGGDIREYFARYRRKLVTREDIRKHSGISPADQKRLQQLMP